MEQIDTGTINVLCALWLGLLLATASWTDLRVRRISNMLVLVGVLSGIALNTALPEGAGLFSARAGGLGPWRSLGGLAAGLGVLLPLYLLRAMGAGDVKLMAMVGTFLGPVPVLGAALLTFLAGGILAIAVALGTGALRSTLVNVRFMMLQSMTKTMLGQGAQIEALPISATGKLPYALAIAAGTITQIVLARSGYAILS